MNDESERVWENLSAELRKVRRRRVAIRVGTVATVVLMGVFFVQRSIDPAIETLKVVKETPVESSVVEVADLYSPQLAVLVYDGEGMRFELMDGERLGSSEMELSLQPVVMGLPRDSW